MRLIDADAAADKIMHDAETHADEIRAGTVEIMSAFARALRDETKFPTVEAKPVRHGRFVLKKGDGVVFFGGWICTACKARFSTRVPYFDHFAYCPICGAKMGGGAKSGNHN